jgi:hypothetical protein
MLFVQDAVRIPRQPQKAAVFSFKRFERFLSIIVDDSALLTIASEITPEETAQDSI